VRSLTSDEQDGINRALLASGTVIDTRPDTAEARLTLDERKRVEDARAQMGLHRTCDTDVGNLLSIIDRLSPPSGGDEAKESEGDGESRPVVCQHDQRADTVQAVDGSSTAEAGVAPGPSEPSPPADRREIVARDTWAYIERLLIAECGLMEDCGLGTERPNLINAIRNALPSPQLLSAAAEFLRAADGLTGLAKVRVNGCMMSSSDIAAALDGGR
jgi:hypothetical protein